MRVCVEVAGADIGCVLALVVCSLLLSFGFVLIGEGGPKFRALSKENKGISF